MRLASCSTNFLLRFDFCKLLKYFADCARRREKATRKKLKLDEKELLKLPVIELPLNIYVIS